jgi:hypothetical protein
MAAMVRVFGEEFPSEDSVGGSFSKLCDFVLVEVVD